MRIPRYGCTGGAFPTVQELEQFSELRDARNGTPHHSILRPAQCFALAPLAKKTLRLFVKCSKRNPYDPILIH
ncbi:hypothetical protein DVJ83_12560 [Deinococcus wulumuqiensis]|uniref:Uncharacterized protein n=1 Tax=Deinococcus wulumuqiensis TaxID=980427 RepID=A0A345IKG5_9DEIO|nr:hypothetical protein DVJ83_12560 [Deinococcus wulumuqiensis]